jgi:hypothetical protein
MAQLRNQDLGRVEPGQLVDQFVSQKARQGKSPGRQLDPGQPQFPADLNNGGQLIGSPGIEQLVIGKGSGRDDPHDVALDESLGLA